MMITRRQGGWLIAAMIGVGGFAAACEDSNGTLNPTLEIKGPTTNFDAGTSDGGVQNLGDPVLGLAGANVDLGLGDCGGSAATKTVEFTNTGAKPLSLGFATNAPFTITPAKLDVAPGAKGSVTLSATVPPTATAGVAITGTVTITTNDPKKPKVDVPVSVTPAGATLAFADTTTSADFGTAKLGVKDTDVVLSVKNTGNKSATVTFGAPGDTQFSVSSAPASPATLNANDTATVTASFTPDKLTPSTSTSSISVTGAVCGSSLSQITLTGQGAVGDLTGWPAGDLDFGASTCGGAAAATKTFTLSNSGAADVKIASLDLGSKGYTTNIAVNAVIPKNGTLDVIVTPPAIPFPSAIPGNYGDTITFTTDLPNDPPHSIAVNVAASGAILEFDTSATQNFGNFGLVPVNTSANHGFAIKNTGNAAANVTLSAGSGPFGVVAGSAVNVPANGTSSLLGATFSPVDNTPKTGELSVGASGLCQPLPSNLQLSGQGVNGGIAISDNTITFQANCGSSAEAKTFTVTNTGNAPMTWSAVLVAGESSPYTISPSGSTLAAGALETITVTPKPIPQYPAGIAPELFADKIQITTDVLNDTNHEVSLQETPIGAVLAFGQNSFDFGDVPVNTSSTPQDITVVNTGNTGSAATVTLVSDNALYAFSTASGVTAPGGAPLASTLTFSPGASPTPSNANLSITTSDPLCAPLPQAIQAKGSGTLAQVAFTPALVDFGLTNCGSTATPKTVTFTNPGNQDYTVTPVLEKGTAFTMNMVPPNGVVPRNNGGAVVITLTPAAIPQSVAVVPSLASFSDTLTVTTTAANDSPHVIDVVQGAKGVILRPIAKKDWDFGVINYGATGFFNQGLRNDGNVNVTVSMSGLTLPEFGFTPTTITASSSVAIKGSFTPSASSGAWFDTGTLTIPNGTVLCQPLPNYDVTMTGKGGDGATLSISGSLAFPSVDCNAPPNSAQSITIRNNGNSALPWNAGFNLGTWYTLSNGSNGTIPANGGTIVISVQPKPITSGPNVFSGSNYNDQLIVNVNGAGYSFPISQLAVGADLSADQEWDSTASNYNEYYSGDNSFFNQFGYYQDTAGVYITNSGNRSSSLATTFDQPTYWSTPNSSTTIQASTSVFQEWRFKGTNPPLACGNNAAHALPVFSGPVCHNTVPASFAVNGYLYGCEQVARGQ